MNKPHKNAEVLRAIADGKEVQWKYLDGYWQEYKYKFNNSPLDCSRDIEWRVKPEPKPDYFKHLNLYKDNSASVWTDLDDCKKFGANPLALVTITFDGETNEPKSVELVK